MSTFNFCGKEIFFEVKGTGKPLLVLNGLMMSVASWAAFEPALSENNKVIFVDFLDQGKSHRMTESYTQDIQVDILKALLDHIGEQSVSVMGISYGGEVAMKFAIKHPNRVSSLVLANTTARTSLWLRDIGYGWNEIGAKADGLSYYYATIPIIYSTKFYTKNKEWFDKRREILSNHFSQKETMQALKRLIDSAENHDVQNQLSSINCPTLIISGADDALIPPSEQRILSEGIKNSQWVTFADCGHASMYEQPMLFANTVLGFVNGFVREIKI